MGPPSLNLQGVHEYSHKHGSGPYEVTIPSLGMSTANINASCGTECRDSAEYYPGTARASAFPIRSHVSVPV